MLCEFGMDEEFGLLATPEILHNGEALTGPVALRLNEMSNKFYGNSWRRPCAR